MALFEFLQPWLLDSTNVFLLNMLPAWRHNPVKASRDYWLGGSPVFIPN
jgi:hypothetical protein